MQFIPIPNTDLRAGMTVKMSGEPALIHSAKISESAPLINGRPPIALSFGPDLDREHLDARGVTYVKGHVHEVPLDDGDVLLTLQPTIDHVPGEEKSEPLLENVQPLKPTAPAFTPRSFPVFPEVTAHRGGMSFSDPYAHLTREQLIERIQDRAADAAKAERRVRKLKEARRRLRRIIEEGQS